MKEVSLFKNLENLAIEDFINFMELSQLLSVRELARRRGRTPSSISRSLAALEDAVGSTLMNRSALGLSVTEEGQKLLGVLNRIVDLTESLSNVSTQERQITIASISFLSTRFIAPSLERLQQKFSEVRMLDFPPDELIASGLRGAFTAALHVGQRDWPQSWTSKKIGDLSWFLCARKDHPLTKKRQLSEAMILEYPFTYPIYWGKSGLVVGDDQFPVSIYKRKRGSATSTAEAAAAVVAVTDQISFLPDIIVLEEVRRGRVTFLAEDRFEVSKPLFLTARSDLMTQASFQWLGDELTAFLGDLRKTH